MPRKSIIGKYSIVNLVTREVIILAL